jgi:hypothetical protein
MPPEVLEFRFQILDYPLWQSLALHSDSNAAKEETTSSVVGVRIENPESKLYYSPLLATWIFHLNRRGREEESNRRQAASRIPEHISSIQGRREQSRHPRVDSWPWNETAGEQPISKTSCWARHP